LAQTILVAFREITDCLIAFLKDNLNNNTFQGAAGRIKLYALFASQSLFGVEPAKSCLKILYQKISGNSKLKIK